MRAAHRAAARPNPKGRAGQALCAATGKSADDVSTYLRALLEPIASHDTDYYNEDAQLGGAINDAVTMAGRASHHGQRCCRRSRSLVRCLTLAA